MLSEKQRKTLINAGAVFKAEIDRRNTPIVINIPKIETPIIPEIYDIWLLSNT